MPEGTPHQARLGAELSHAESHRASEPGTGLLAAFGRRGLGATTRLGEPGSPWHGPGAHRVDQGASGTHRAGEAGRCDQRVPVQLDARVEAVDQGDGVLGQTALGGGAAQQCGGGQLRGGRGVGLDAHGAAGGAGAGGVATDSEKASGKLLAAYTATTPRVPAAQVRPGRGAVRVGVVDADVEEGAFVADVGEGTQLRDCARDFAGRPGRSERGLTAARLFDEIADAVVATATTNGVRGADRTTFVPCCGLRRNPGPRLPGSRVNTQTCAAAAVSPIGDCRFDLFAMVHALLVHEHSASGSRVAGVDVVRLATRRSLHHLRPFTRVGRWRAGARAAGRRRELRADGARRARAARGRGALCPRPRSGAGVRTGRRTGGRGRWCRRRRARRCRGRR